MLALCRPALRRPLRCVLLLSAAGLVRAAAAQPVHTAVHTAVHYAPLANLTYQLDCVGGAPISCSGASYQPLWAREFLRTAADSARLAAWRQVRARVPAVPAAPTVPAVAAATGPRGPTRTAAGGPPPDRADATDRPDPVRLIGLRAGDVDAYAAALDTLLRASAAGPGAPGGGIATDTLSADVLSADDRAALVAAVRHFAPAFARWWARVARAEGGPFAARMAGLLAEPGVTGQLARTARFYGARLGAADTLAFVLLYRPAADGADAGTRGQQLGRYALVEFVPGEAPEARLDVAVHELCHYLYQRAPLARAAALYARVLASRRPSAAPAYNLLDEVLASAAGNGLMARRRLPAAAFDRLLARPGALYDRDEVDRGAKAVLPWLARWVEAGRTLHDPAFAPAYLAHMERALGPALGAPRVHLNRMVLVVDAALGGDAERAVRRALRPSSYAGGTRPCCGAAALAELRARPRASALLVVAPDRLPALAAGGVLPAATLADIRARLATAEAVTVTAPRAPEVPRAPAGARTGAYTFVVVARDAAGAGRALARLAALPAPVVGVLPEVPVPGP